jgi:hypothetical protein
MRQVEIYSVTAGNKMKSVIHLDLISRDLHRFQVSSSMAEIVGGEGRESNPPGILRLPDWF